MFSKFYFRCKDKKGGIFKDRALKDAFDILSLSLGDPLIFTYSSGFGALALQLKQVREDYCSNWASLDWGKREWPAIGTIGQGGVRGVKFGTELASKICYLSCNGCEVLSTPYCSVQLNIKNPSKAPIVNRCNCR